ncbi:MAG: hypothetical protein MUF00_20560 [Gemmatimonadaceae bacterium]|nr:hypothetical protein [Gemmatimonadaceae bacterium]
MYVEQHTSRMEGFNWRAAGSAGTDDQFEAAVCRTGARNWTADAELTDLLEWADGVCPSCVQAIRAVWEMTGIGGAVSSWVDAGRVLRDSRTSCGERAFAIGMAVLSTHPATGRAATRITPHVRSIISRIRPSLSSTPQRMRNYLFDKRGNRQDARQLFDELTTDMRIYTRSDRPHAFFATDDQGSFITFRLPEGSESGLATLDFNVGGVTDVWKIKFVP